MTSCLRMEIKFFLFLPERSFATATNSFDFVSFLFSPLAINLHSRIGVLWSVRQLLFGLDKFLTMSTEFDKNSSKWSYYSTDHKNYIKDFFEPFPSKLLDPQKSTFGDVILGIKLFF